MTRDQLEYNCSHWHHQIITLMSFCALASDKDARIKGDNDELNTNEVHREIKLTVHSLYYRLYMGFFNVFVLFHHKN